MKESSQAVKDEKEIATYPSSDGSDDEFRKPVYESDRIEARIKQNFCIPLFEKHNFIVYCSFAKMPGIWLASWKREGYEFPSRSYNPTKHVIKNCLRQLARKEYEHFFGKCYYSMTNYNNIVRIVIPHKKIFLIALNAQLKIMKDDFRQLDQDYYRGVVQKIEELKEKCTMKSQLFKEEKISSADMLKDFFSDEPKNLLELNESLKNIDFNKKMRYIAIGTREGIPLARLVNTNKPMLLSKFDEFEYFIENASGIKMRDHFSSIFGGTKFNLVVYEKIAAMTIPVADEFFVLAIFDNKMKDKEASPDEKKCEHNLYFPESMTAINKFIKNYDVMKDFKS